MATSPQFTNRLVHQKSPYLLQHAHNPVDWYPWGSEAFHASKSQDKPIFLSIGYATCHWCHVMERESFQNEEVAQLLNDAFINIKIDREELPEVDALYMEFAQGMMSGAAGWPLNIVLTPDLQPFFAATYLPPFGKHGLMGLAELVARVKEVWHGEERELVIEQASKVVDVFTANMHTTGDDVPDKELLADASDMLFKLADPVHGGMRGTPKFPLSYQYDFMMRYAARSGDGRALFLVERTLKMMHRGGIDDHLGGGFSRYSVDEKWEIPHFEKMLYDNALLAFTYLQAWQITQNAKYRQGCEEILDYLVREMQDSEGGFYSAEDADSEGREGLFYTWIPSEVYQVLGSEKGRLFCEFYDVTEEGNFEGRNVLHEKETIDDFAAKRGLDPSQLEIELEELRHTLFAVRELRVHPLKDDKVLSSWNGLAIFALTEAGSALGNRHYIEAALLAATFIKKAMWREGQLYRRWREGETSFAAGLDEYAFLLKGLLSLFEAGCGNEWLVWGMEIADILKSKFKVKEGAFYQTDGEDSSLILRKCQFADGAEPSGNAIHCENLFRLYQITLENDYFNQARDVLKAVKKYLDSYPPGYCFHLMNLNRYYDRQAPTFVFALGSERDIQEKESQLRHLLYSNFLPHKAVIWRRQGDQEQLELIPSLKDQIPIDGKTTLYPCYQGTCQQPISDWSAIIEKIQKR